MADIRVGVGHSPPRPDGPDKVTGRAQFIDDISFSDLWYGATVRCAHAHARILGIDTSGVSDPEAVIVTAKDLPGPNVVRAIADDWPSLASEVVNHAYEAVALVAAPTRERAERAAREVVVRAQPLPAVLTYDEALARGESFVLSNCGIDHGDVDHAFGEPRGVVIEGTYETGHQEHLYIEPHGLVAEVKKDGAVEITGSLQCPFYVLNAVRYFMGTENVRVRQVTTGGGFGGKEDCPSLVATHAAVLALRSGHPVKIIYDRHEDIIATSKRHPSRIHIRSAVSPDGTVLAHDIEVLFDGGAYITMSPVVLSRGVLHAQGPYRCANVRVRAKALRTNTCPNGAFRGFGAPQTQFAMERQMDRIARVLGLDPFTLRERNAFVEQDVTATGQVLDSVGARDCLLEAEKRTEFRRRWLAYEDARKQRGQADGAPMRGLGLSLFWHGAGFTGNGEKRIGGKAAVRLNQEGVVEILASSTDIGQGTLAAFENIVTSIGFPAARVRMNLPDTGLVPNSGPTVASRTIMIVGELIVRAGQRLAAELCQYVSKSRNCATVKLSQGRFEDGRGELLATFEDLARAYLSERGPLYLEEQFRPLPEQEFDETTYRGMAYSAYAWGCDVVEVEVNPDTLETKPVRVTTVSDVGRAIHPVLCAGQIDGGTLQALGWGVLEEMKTKDGRYQNDRLATYIIPTTRDAPAIETVLLEHPARVGPFGAKGIGEMPLDGGAPALLAAIENATGVVVTTLPASPERILTEQRLGHVVAAPKEAR